MEITLENVTKVCKNNLAMQHPREVLPLIHFLAESQVKSIVELGVHRGGLSVVFRTFIPKAKVVGVEIYPIDEPPETIERIEGLDSTTTLREVADKYNFTVVQADSQKKETLDEVVKIIGGQIDFVFIDAAHDYDSVKKDYELWSPYARYIGFHDVHNYNSVYKFWEEIINEKTSFGLWKEPDGLGVGLIVR